MATQLAVRHMEMGSRTTYTSALRRFLEGCGDDKNLVNALDDMVQQLARRLSEASATRGLLTVVRMLEKLRFIPPTNLTGHWMRVKGIKRITASNIGVRVFAETSELGSWGSTGNTCGGSACSFCLSVRTRV